LWVPTEHDKTGAQREIPLTKRSLEALDAVAPKSGLIFGDHDYRDLLQAAAKKALPDYKAKTFCAQHLRSAGLTVLAELSPTGAQMIAGHKYLSTTSIYVRAREKEASKVIEMINKRHSGE
jgi:integrase